VLYQLCRAGERFEVGDGPVPLALTAMLLGRGDAARTDAGEGVVFVDDPWMSSRHAQVAPLERKGTDSAMRMKEGGAPARYVVEDLGSTNGVMVNGVPTRKAPLLHGDLIETGRTFWLYLEEPAGDPLLAEPYELGGVATWTPPFARQLGELLPRVPGPDHVLLTGPEGTGKGFMARTIHVVSGRTGRFVHLDCRERGGKRLLVDLFGDERNAGRLKDAANGTLFLEHVDALPLDVQDRLAEALAKRSFAAEGRARSVVGLSARVVACMTSTIDDALGNATLRPGLVDAFAGVHVALPGIKQRAADLGLLLDDFLARGRGASAITREACRAVLRHPFRHNVRALGRVIEAAATLAAKDGGKGIIDVVHLPVDVLGLDGVRAILAGAAASVPENTSEMAPITSGTSDLSEPSQPDPDATDPYKMRRRTSTPPVGNYPPSRPPSWSQAQTDDEVQAFVDPDAVTAALKAAHGNVSAAARALGRPRAVVLRWIREFGIDPARLR
jgi:DNA-binding NtrC family response regulator